MARPLSLRRVGLSPFNPCFCPLLPSLKREPIAAQLPANRQRQLQLFELENRQKMWRWLLAGVLGLVVVETALAGRLTRRGGSARQRSQDPSTLEQQQVPT